MHRRDYLKGLLAVPVTPSIPHTIPELGKNESRNERQWNVRGVWGRRDGTGHLAVQDTQAEIETYDDWHSAVIQNLWDEDGEHISYLFDFRLISIYNGSSCRSHFTHDEADLEVTIRRNPGEEVDYSALVRGVDETLDESRIYHSRFLHRLKSKIAREREEYL